MKILRKKWVCPLLFSLRNLNVYRLWSLLDISIKLSFPLEFIHFLIVHFIDFINNLWVHMFFNVSKNFSKKTCFEGWFSFSLLLYSYPHLSDIFLVPSVSSLDCLIKKYILRFNFRVLVPRLNQWYLRSRYYRPGLLGIVSD